MVDPLDDEEIEEEIEFEFEVHNSEDMKILTLICHSDKPLDPADFAYALKAFADRIEVIVSMEQLSSGTLN